MMRSLLVGAFLLAAALCSAMPGQGTRIAPVTVLEVNATLVKVEKAIGTLPGMKSYKPHKRAPKPGVASRTYIIQELNGIFERVKPKFKFTPRKIAFDPKALSAKPGTMSALQKLVAWGFVARLGPLATGPEDSLQPKEYGDALGFFVARVTDLTHSPDPKYSPGMMDRIGG